MKKTRILLPFLVLALLALALSLSACDGGETSSNGETDQPSDEPNHSICNGHSYGVWITDKEPTCVAEGKRHHTCTVCQTTESEALPIDPTAHSFSSEWTVSATQHYRACLHEGCSEAADRAAHLFLEWVTDKEATCVAEGERHRTCSICAKNETEILPPDETAHVFSTECTADFTYIYTACTVKGCTATQKREHKMSFNRRGDGTYLVSRYSGREETVVVPAVYQGASVAGIGMSAFHNQDTIRSILLPDSIEFIGDGAFYSCDALSSITLPSGITSIGENAFEFCTGLTAITIPAAVELIGDRIISHCDSLVSITVEKGNAVYHSSGNCLIETQSKTLLAGCKSSVIPSDGSVTAIGEDAFAGCLMTDITIPAAITSIGESAFKHCENLTTVRYLGTRAMWSAIKKGDFWNGGSTPTITLQCTDGSLTIA